MNNYFSTEIQPPFVIKFISEYYDHPQKGYGYDKEYKRYYQFDYEHFDNSIGLYHFTVLGQFSLLHWRIRQWLFETCVGFRWSPEKNASKLVPINSWKFKLYYKVLKYV